MKGFETSWVGRDPRSCTCQVSVKLLHRHIDDEWCGKLFLWEECWTWPQAVRAEETSWIQGESIKQNWRIYLSRRYVHDTGGET